MSKQSKNPEPAVDAIVRLQDVNELIDKIKKDWQNYGDFESANAADYLKRQINELWDPLFCLNCEAPVGDRKDGYCSDECEDCKA